MIRGSSLRLLRPSLLQPIIFRNFSVTPVLHARKKETTTEPKPKKETKAKKSAKKEATEDETVATKATKIPKTAKTAKTKATKTKETKETETETETATATATASESTKDKIEEERQETIPEEKRETKKSKEIEEDYVRDSKIQGLINEFNTFSTIEERSEKDADKPVTLEEIVFNVNGPPTYNKESVKSKLEELETKLEYKRILSNRTDSVLSVLADLSKKFATEVDSDPDFLESKKKEGTKKSMGNVYRFLPKTYLKSSPSEVSQASYDKPQNWPLLKFQGFSEEIINDKYNTPVPKLHHNLSKVLFSPGVHTLRDLSTKKYNFPRFLEKIDQPEDIDYSALPPFVTSSKDEELQRLASQNGSRFTGSTSSVSPLLAQLFFVVSDFSSPSLLSLTADMQRMPSRFTKMSRKPACAFMRVKDNGIFAVDSDPGSRIPDNQILMDLGKSMERWLTMPHDDFKSTLLKSHQSDSPKAKERESYLYLKSGPFMFRSQQDCEHNDIPGDRKVFDLKARAIYEVRKDCLNYQNASKFRLDFLLGHNHSFEREYYDMVRASFIKNYFQVRIGQMAGLFITYHNTQEVFGFEYISRDELESVLFGSSLWGQKIYESTVQLLSEILNLITSRHPKNCRIVFRAQVNTKSMDIFVEEVGDADKGWRDPLELAQQHFETQKTKKEFTTFDEEYADKLQIIDAMKINPDNVFWYQLSVLKFVNGASTTPISYNPGDNLEIFYNVFDNTEHKTKLSTYMECLTSAHIYKEFD